MSPGGVHSHQGQIAALCRILAKAGLKVAVHAALDGRDTPPQSALGYLKQFKADTEGAGDIRIATICGRYYAMDRDKRWDRVEKAYAMLTEAAGHNARRSGRRGRGRLRARRDRRVRAADRDRRLGRDERAATVCCWPISARDRVREIAAALLDPGFSGFARDKLVDFSAALGLVEYSEELNRFLATLFPPENLKDTFGEIVSRAGMTQLRIAETEKYAHVTFFFNGGRETVFPGEERILVPSPKVATYDKQPQMSAPEVTDKVVAAIQSGKFDVVVLNYANTDMVGHTGLFDAAEHAVEAVDACLGRLAQAVETAGGTLVITADHGNAEMMRDPETGAPHTAHTLNPVPFIVVNPPASVRQVQNGRLADVAPTLLALLALPLPAAMTGHSLLGASEARRRAAG